MRTEPLEILDPSQIRSYLEMRDFRKLRLLFKEHEIADVAELFSQLELTESIALFRLVPRDKRAGLFSELEFERQKELIQELPDIIVTSFLDEMDPDDRTRLFEELPEELRDLILQKLSPEERRVAKKLLSYPEDSVGRLMTPDFLTLKETMTVSQAMQFIHWSTALPEEFLNYLFVTGDDGTLIGEVSLASLVLCDPPRMRINEIMKKSRIFLSPFDEAQRAVDLFRKYDNPYIPVVDTNKKIIGIVTADDVFDVAEEEATEDIHQFGGQGALEDSYFNTPFFTMFRKRAGALAILFVSGFLTSETLQVYHDTLTHWGFLSFFIPLIIASGGNSGTQAASLIIRGLAISEFEDKDSWRILRNEILIGLTLGIFLAVLWYLRAYFTELSAEVTFVVGVSIIGVVLFGVISGAMLPFLFRLMKLDPAVVSSPFISTLVDVMGILIFLNIAIWVFKIP
ncbi:MAG: magnesium transporter [Deltaproteobacteria bacterium]|nr:magnesium transporter [Deltaproteobacteria bacterium]